MYKQRISHHKCFCYINSNVRCKLFQYAANEGTYKKSREKKKTTNKKAFEKQIPLTLSWKLELCSNEIVHCVCFFFFLSFIHFFAYSSFSLLFFHFFCYYFLFTQYMHGCAVLRLLFLVLFLCLYFTFVMLFVSRLTLMVVMVTTAMFINDTYRHNKYVHVDKPEWDRQNE